MNEEVGLKTIEDIEGSALKWVQPSSGRYYELAGSGGVYATLRWEGIFGSLATGRTRGDSYTFKRGGFLLPYVTVRKAPYDQDIGRMRMGFGGGGDLEMADGRRFAFTKTGFWSPEWSFHSENGNKICTYKMASTFLKRQADVLLELDPKRAPNIEMLLILGWYVIILQADEAAAAASGGAAMASMH